MRANSNINVAFAFGPFKLIPSQQLLVRDGRPVKVGGRAIDILHLLLLREGQVVDKDALIAFAWPNVYVEESNLKVHISSLRRALEDALPQPTYIATVAGRGYQFVERVQIASVEAADFTDEKQLIISTLPSPSRLIGRQRDLEGITRALDLTRFVTLVGPGGVGKTSLAIAVAHAKQSEFPDGVHFVNLSATNTSALVPHLLAVALGFRSNPADVIATLVEYLRSKRVLLILDNCEHVLHAVAAVAAQLTQAEISSCILATSREPLGIPGENVQRVESLAFPPSTKTAKASEALAYPAVELFALRAFETADYQLADVDSGAVARLCEALDGLPLAIEIAAAKLVSFSAAELLESVTRHIRDLQNDDEGAHARHRTLWATLDWSYQLLTTHEATLFRLLSVFAGHFQWTDVANMSRLAHFEPYQTTVALGALVSKSLLSVELDGERLRYRFFECTKSYGAERLQQDVLARAANMHHANLVLAMFLHAETEWATAGNRVWRARYEAGIGDLRKALDWCFGHEGDPSLGIDLAVSAIRFWDEQSSVFEQLFQVERALSYCVSLHNASEQMAALAVARAWTMTYIRKLHAETDSAWRAALDLSNVTGVVHLQLSAMSGYANFFIWTGDYERAIRILERFTHLADQIGDRATAQDGERSIALVEIQQGKLLAAQNNLEKLSVTFDNGMRLSTITRYQSQRYVYTQGTLVFTRWLTGEPAWALATVEEMVHRTGQSNQLIAQSTVIAFVAMPLTLLSGNVEDLERYAVILLDNLSKENVSFFQPIQRFYPAAIRQLKGDATAIDEMRSIVESDIRDRFRVRAPMHLGVLAGALLAEGSLDEADAALEWALTLLAETEENWCLPELLRVKARIISSLGNPGDGRDMLLKAREHAIDIGARTLELRIVNDIAETLLGNGRGDEAAQLLAPVYRSFKGGLATGDLKHSGVLLAAANALSGRSVANILSGSADSVAVPG